MDERIYGLLGRKLGHSWSTAPTAFSSWSRMDWLPFFTGRTSAA